ncbi:MAG: hypothetical protein JWR50_1665 [Mucilaginibacter sp.]|nr:hypothetical protein [Mucilaginibacter sp.]
MVYYPGEGTFSEVYNSDTTGVHPMVLTLTSLSSTSVQGTFSGELLEYHGNKVKYFTNGKFNATLH